MIRELKPVAWALTRVPRLRSALPVAFAVRGQLRRLPRWAWALSGLALLLLTLSWETHTGVLESRLFAQWAKGLTYYIQPGPTNGVVFPTGGPADVRRGYTRIPEFAQNLKSHGFRIAEQARFSPALVAAARFGISPPYREPAVTGLSIEGADGGDLFEAPDQTNGFVRYEEIPPVVVRSLLFIENRELDKETSPWSNPAIDWGRWTKAVLIYSANRFGFPIRVEGGSTLAVQVEKYRHSEDGRTGSPVDKLRQVLTASLRVYQEGPDTRKERQHIILDYLNSVPLGATPAHGEVFGLNQGLSVWFGLDPSRTMGRIRNGKTVAQRASAVKHVLALLCAVRAPSRYLAEDRAALEQRADAYATLLAREGVLDSEFAERVRAVPLSFASPSTAGRDHRIPPASKAANRIRIDLEQALAVGGLYDLNRLHLDVESTIDAGLQRETEELMGQLSDSTFLARNGLKGVHLLSQGDPKRVIYSVLLCERTPQRNEIRVHADNLRRPFDVNEGVKMALGSTAKVRALVHYLEIMEELHRELSDRNALAIGDYERKARDPLTRWACETLLDYQSMHAMPADSFLDRAVERTYSASPGERFFTGGGVHTFVNFDPTDNLKTLTIRDAAAHSTNLVFVRLMRDIVRYHVARLPYSAENVLSGEDSLTRQSMLADIAEEESKATIGRAYRDYHGLTPRQSLDRLLGAGSRSPRRLAIAYFAWHPGAPAESLGAWLRQYAGLRGRFTARGIGPSLKLEDCAYLLGKDPLEVWCAGTLARDPGLSQEGLTQASGEARRQAWKWLFRTQNRHAQDLRLRTRIERDAFTRMTPYWRRLGFPFERLVPSYATAIGSSADRPAALAELMGIIVNEGLDRPAQRINRLVFAPGTPYHTALEAEAPASHRLLSPAVARTARSVLTQVVESEAGTARRLKDLFRDASGKPIPVGGKTGTGDNRFDTFARGGKLLSSQVVSRTAAFTFFIGGRYYGVVTASVFGRRAGQYRFTSALPLRVLELLAPSLERRLDAPPPQSEQLASLEHLDLNSARPVEHVNPDVTLVSPDDQVHRSLPDPKLPNRDLLQTLRQRRVIERDSRGDSVHAEPEAGLQE